MRFVLAIFISATLLSCESISENTPKEIPLKDNFSDESTEVDVDLSEVKIPQSNIHSVPIPDVVTFAGDTVPIWIPDVREDLEHELMVNTFRHSSTLKIIKNIHRWRPFVEEILEENQVPTDLIYLAVAESEFDNTAQSFAGASGMWQFMKGTAKDYDLPITRDVDMRRDPKLATEAASKYLKWAHNRFDDWALAAAAYNRGVGGVSGKLREQKVNSFYDLHLNKETSRYFYRILSFKLILENPKAYGYFIEDSEKYQPYEFTTLKVEKDINNLVDFAKKHGTTYKELRILNPWFNNSSNYRLDVPRNGSYTIRIPKKK